MSALVRVRRPAGVDVFSSRGQHKFVCLPPSTTRLQMCYPTYALIFPTLPRYATACATAAAGHKERTFVRPAKNFQSIFVVAIFDSTRTRSRLTRRQVKRNSADDVTTGATGSATTIRSLAGITLFLSITFAATHNSPRHATDKPSATTIDRT